jgi:tetratricopeptide (TPR) repeat protein
MNNVKKRLLLYLSIGGLFFINTPVYSYQNTSSDKTISSEQLNIRISKDNYTDFRETLILNYYHPNFQLNRLYSTNFNINKVNITYFDLIASLSEPQTQKRITRETPNLLPPNIYKINIHSAEALASNQTSPVNINKANSIDVSNYSIMQLMEKTEASIKNKQMYNARIYLDNALSKAGKNSWTLAEIASKYERMNLPDKANSTWEKALISNPNRIELLYSYALYLIRTDQEAKALKYLNKIIGINPNFMLAYYNLGNIYFESNQYINAIRSYFNAITINPYSEDTYYNLGLSLEAINQKYLAAKYYKECIKLNPSDRQAKAALKRINL